MATQAGRAAELEALDGRVGKVLGHSHPYVIPQGEEDAFATLIGDWDPMHNDPNWRFDAAWTGTVVLGFQVLARAERFLEEVGVPCGIDSPTTFLTVGIGRVRFASPFPVSAKARCQVRLDALEHRTNHVLIRTTLTNKYEGGERPTMVAEHIGALFFEEPRFGVIEQGHAPLVAAIPKGSPIAPAAVHDESFYESVARRSTEWLGSTPWTVVGQREADAFAALTGGLFPLYNKPAWARDHSPFGGTILRPLQLLTLRSYFMPYVGLPVLSDERMAAFNYGLDRVRWYAPVTPETPLRDHVLLEGGHREIARSIPSSDIASG